MEYLAAEILVHIAQYIHTRDVKCLRCVCTNIKNVFEDPCFMDLGTIKLYKHQKDAAKFLLDRESIGLSSIVNLDTGIGKTATVLYSYLKNPVPTLIVAKSKIHSVWADEMRKYNITLPICEPMRVALHSGLDKYKRIIYDEIHESPSSDKNKKDKFIAAIKGKVIWGLSALELHTGGGEFRLYHLRQIFGAPDCMITITTAQLEDDVKCNFALPKFEQIDFERDIDKIVKEKYPRVAEYRAIYKYIKSIMDISGATSYDGLGHMLYRDMVDPCEYINDDGSFLFEDEWVNNTTPHRILCTIDDLRSRVRKEYFDKKINELTVQGTKRSIVYLKRGPYMSNPHILGSNKEDSLSYDNYCNRFIHGKYNVLIIPSSYNAGFNFGKIDVVIITKDVTYAQFRQMMGRINRLNTNNKDTIVYLPTDIRGSIFSNYIAKYKNEFVDV